MSATNAPSWPDQRETLRRTREHARRCAALPPLKPGEADRLVAEYVAKQRSFTRCPAAYLIPVQH